MNTITDSDDGNPALKKIARAALKEWQSHLQSIVEDGQDRKEIQAEVALDEVHTGLPTSLALQQRFDVVDISPLELARNRICSLLISMFALHLGSGPSIVRVTTLFEFGPKNY